MQVKDAAVGSRVPCSMEFCMEGEPARHTIIQGGMGIGVSNWRLARAVSMQGQIGVVSGTALNSVLVRRLQDGDADGSMRRALARCPLRESAERILARYWIEGGRPAGQPYRLSPLFSLPTSLELIELTVVASFVEVFLAREGHDGLVGINLLEKIQLPTLATLFGAMLAGVGCVLMGAGIPRAIPGALDRLAAWEKVELPIRVEGTLPGEEHRIEFDPADFPIEPRPALRRPAFLAIVSSAVLATMLARKASGRVDGFVVEGFTAGGHNAPPRGGLSPDADAAPVYGPRDAPDLAAIRALGRPFWLAGSYAHPSKLLEARALGAAGVQIGTAFAFCEESGLDENLKRDVLQKSLAGEVEVQTDARVSPTGLPFKVIALDRTLSDRAVYRRRERKCDLGYLREAYRKADGSFGYRCPAEPEDDYVRKGGNVADTVGRKCLCNGLLAAVGLGQALGLDASEPAILTAGEDIVNLRRFVPAGTTSYGVADVLRFMTEGVAPVA